MKPIVYVDILFMINFLMNSIIIYSTSLFIKRQIHIIRLILSASILALYAVFMFFPQLSFLYSVFFKVLVLFLTMLFAFPSQKAAVLLKNTIIFFTLNLVFGGMCFALIFLTDFGLAMGAVISNGEIYFNISAETLIISVVPAYISIYILSYIRKNIIRFGSQISTIQITFDKKEISLKALADTGCMVTEPIQSTPVIIISKRISNKLLSQEFFYAVKSGFSGEDGEKYIKPYRIIPYNTITSSGVMHGFIPDKIIINNRLITNVVIGISDKELSSNSEFDAVFNPDILTKNYFGRNSECLKKQ